MRFPLLLCLLVSSFLLGACDPHAHPPPGNTPDAGPDPADLVPALFDVESTSDGQAVTVGTALPKPLVVRVVNRHNKPLAGVEVRWALVEGTGTLGGTASTTDVEGRARMTLTLGTVAGVRRVRATVSGLQEVLSLSARGLPGAVARVTVTSPDSKVEVDRTLKLTVALADAHGNAIANQAVTWESSDERIAGVGSDGTVLGVRTGTVRLTATSGGVRGHVDLEVVWPTNATVFTSVSAAGNMHACATLLSGGVWCWGEDSDGALGNGADTTVKKTPSRVTMPEGVKFTKVTTGGDSSCALSEEGAAWCWGRNNYGQLGDDTTTERDVPVAVRMPEGVGFTTLGLSKTHACGLTAGGAAWCWGFNFFGNLGDGTLDNSATPVSVRLPAGVTGFRAISPGGAYTCGVSTDGDVYCWGFNSVGQLGDGTEDSRETPAKVSTPAGVLFDTVHAAYDHACAVSRGGELYCWGNNESGQLGDGTTTSRQAPVKVSASGGMTFAAVSGEVDRTCALTKTGGELYCWGQNPSGQLGNGTQVDASKPVKVLLPAGVGVTTMSSGPMVTCATTTAGEAFCWGENLNGLLGNGSAVLLAKTPVKVTEPVVP
jgi:alpha-tubulin suppressor-like RCC1 family protein